VSATTTTSQVNSPPEASTGRWRVGLIGLLLVAGVLLAPSSALAAKVVVNSIGGSESVEGGHFSFPRGVAINTTGNGGVPAGSVYVVDTFHNRVQVFSSTGQFQRAFGADVGGPEIDICTVAASCASGTAGSAAGQLGTLRGIAIDQANGNVYLTDESNRRVDVFSAAGAFEGAFGFGVKLSGTAEELQFCTSATGCQAGSISNGSDAGAFSTGIGYPGVAPVGSPEAGHVYVADRANRRIDEFNPTITAGEVTGISFVRGYGWGVATGAEEFQVCTASCQAPAAAGPSLGQFSTNAPSQLGIDATGNVYALDAGNHRVQKFSPAAVPLESSFAAAQLSSGPAPSDLAVDPSPGGHVYVDKSNEAEINTLEFDSSGSLVATNAIGIGITFSSGLAFDSTTGNIWLSSGTENRIYTLNAEIPPTAVLTEPVDVTGPNSALFEGEVNPEGFDAGYHFEYSSDGGASWTSFPIPDVDLGPGTAPIPVSQEATTLLANTEYFVRLVATKPFGGGTATSAEASFQTPAGPPRIDSISASNITANSAELTAQVNPQGADVSTTPPNQCSFQYIDESAYLAAGESYGEGTRSVPCSPADLGSGSTARQTTITISGLAAGTTYHYRLVAANSVGSATSADQILRTLGSAGLPDGRHYEMVSPPQKLGEVFPIEPTHNLGGRAGKSCLLGECLPGVNATLAPMQSAPNGEAIVFQGQPFSPGLAAGPNEYLSRRSPGGWGTSQSLSPALASNGANQGFKAFSSDLSRGVLYQIEPALSPEAPVREGEAFANLYLTDSAGSLRPLITEAPPHREPGELSEDFHVSYGGSNAGSATVPALTHVVFSADDALTGEVPNVAPEAPEVEASSCILPFQSCNLYEWTGGELRLVNVLPGNTATVPGAVLGSGRLLPETSGLLEKYAAAADNAISADGSRIFWTDEATGQVYVRIDGERTEEIKDHAGRFLTASPDGSKVLLTDGCLYDLEVEPPAQPCEDLTAGQGEFEGILGASEDLSRIYFVDRAALTGSEEENANGEHAEPEAFNLYAWDEGETNFIGRLLNPPFEEGGDNQIGSARGFGAWKPSSQNRTAQVSPDGRFLAFMSKASLTGYDNEVSEVTGEGCKGEEGGSAVGGTVCFEVFEYDADSEKLTCASCNPTGQRPLGQSNLSLLRQAPQPGNLSADGQGRLFFESQDTLSTGDTNGAIQDVYEWEPNGVGSCRQANGCVALISSGHASGDSFFFDGSLSGNDAFIVTREQLLPQDKDDRLDLYDARVGGGVEAGTTAPCNGEACKGPISGSPQLPTPASSEFSGAGNLKPAKHKKHKKHKKKKAKHGNQHKQSAKHNGGGAQ
jgi:hypothetical protein